VVDVIDGRLRVASRDRSLDLTYREWSGDGQPIVLLHGLASSSRIWEQVAGRLAPRWRVVALDQRGHGRSDKPDGGYDFATIVADGRAALAALAVERPLLVGHSWGGNVALQWAVEAGPGPRGLVLVDGGFLDPARRMSWAEAEQRLRPPDLRMPLDQFRARVRERLGGRWSEAWEAATLSNFWVDGDGTLQRNLSIENHMKIVRALYDQSASALFGRVRCPTLLVPADPPAEAGPPPEQRSAKAEAVGLAEQALGRLGRTVWMRETVHDVPLQRPAELARLIEEAAAADA
jgi:pimeloyl-ACP methyl ester carboxylesterase